MQGVPESSAPFGSVPVNYLASVTDFFKSPKWGMNLLLGAVCFLIPYVGMIVIQGWHITGFWTRKDVHPEAFPEFDFGQFGKYLQRGLWPFLVALVIGLVLLPVVMIIMFVSMFAFSALMGGLGREAAESVIPILGIFVMLGVWAAVMVGLHLVALPFMLGATITQDFGRAFNFGFASQFVGKVWMEMLLSALFFFVVGIVLYLAGALACLVGIYATVPLIMFAWHHLEKQLYQLYLSRGGEPLPPAPGLFDTPPPFPPPALPTPPKQPG